jgi:hypothetical protein
MTDIAVRQKKQCLSSPRDCVMTRMVFINNNYFVYVLVPIMNYPAVPSEYATTYS